jgi:uncharacterized membrane protein
MTTQTQKEEKETARIEAFSDGVFAIAITLLVLELHVPKPAELGNGSLLAALWEEWPSYFGFVISFFTILIMWFNHHKLFTYIKRSDHVLPYANGFLLFFITLTPWPTALMAEYIGQPQERIAVSVFAAFFVMMAVSFNTLWRYASHKGRLLGPDADMKEVRRISKMYALGPTGYLAAFLLSFVSVPACLIVSMLLAIFFVFTGASLPSGRVRAKKAIAANEPE